MDLWSKLWNTAQHYYEQKRHTILICVCVCGGGGCLFLSFFGSLLGYSVHILLKENMQKHIKPNTISIQTDYFSVNSSSSSSLFFIT